MCPVTPGGLLEETEINQIREGKLSKNVKQQIKMPKITNKSSGEKVKVSLLPIKTGLGVSFKHATLVFSCL